MTNKDKLFIINNKIQKVATMYETPYQVKVSVNKLTVSLENKMFAEVIHTGSMWTLHVSDTEFMNLGDPGLEILEILIRDFKNLE